METSEVYQWASKLDAMDADDIAEFFRAEGVTGRPGLSQRCPIANFLSRYAATEFVSVGVRAVWWVELVASPDGSEFGGFVDGVFRTSDGPSGIRSFILRFDDGQYPDLIEPTVIQPTPQLVNA